MKLTRIEARRYGALENACLEGLGDGLTAILGPNESGKSSFTALTRHVLYGYPDARTNERRYAPAAGEPAARLVFAGAEGEWAIDRVGGPKRGPVSVTALSGVERPGLVGEIVGGVSEQAFRIVFGFGLDELDEIEHGKSEDIVAQLYAAGAGLAVNPMAIRKQIEDRAQALYKPGAQKPTVNALASQARTLRDAIRDLEAEASSYAAEQSRLRELAEEMAPIKARRDELDARSRLLERDAGRAVDAEVELGALKQSALDADAVVVDCERGVEIVDVDERVLGVAAELDSLLEDASAFRQQLETLAAADAAVAEADRKIAASPELPVAAADSVENRTAIDAWRDRLVKLRAEADAAARNAEQAEARAEGTSAAVDGAAGTASPGSGSPVALVLAGISLVLGVVFIAAGLLLSQILAAAFGAIVVVLGGVSLAIAVLGRTSGATTPAFASADVVRLRAEAKTQRTLADGAAQKLQAAQAQWRSWLAENNLDAFGDDPAAVVQLLEALKQRAALAEDRARLAANAVTVRAAAEAWVVRLVDVVRAFDESASQIPPLSGAMELASRARVTLERTRAAQLERTDLERELGAARAEARRLAARLQAVNDSIAELAAQHGLDADNLGPALQSAAEVAAEELGQLRGEYERLAEEHAALRGRLDDEGRDDRMTRARQELEGLRARAAIAADSYVVDSLALRLLDRARERYERERQPEVVRTAARVFSAVTKGRYTDVRIALGDNGITVLGADGVQRTTAELSRGTAEQLYLALRIGLISSLGEQGRYLPILMDDIVVNFDPERRAGAAVAIAELASRRQVLFFTCNPDTAHELVSAVPGSKLVVIDRCSLRG